MITATAGPVHIHVHGPWDITNFNKYNNTAGGSIEGRNFYKHFTLFFIADYFLWKLHYNKKVQ